MSSPVKVTYFNFSGKAEPTRMALSAAGIKFDDERLTSDQWKERKPKTPQGVLPLLTVKGGQEITQSGAMLRHVGREYKLYGKDNMEMTMVDVVLETAEDIMTDFSKAQFEKDEATKSKNLAEFKTEKLPKYVKIFCEMLSNNNGKGKGNGWLVGQQLTIADISLYCVLDLIKTVGKPDAEMTKTLDNKDMLAHSARVASQEKIKAWLAKRPVAKLPS